MRVHALLQETLALGARLGVAEILLARHSVLTDAHDEHVAILELRCIAELLDAVPLRVDRILTIPASTTTTAYAIRGNTDDFPSMDKHGNMKASAIGLSHPTGVGVRQKVLEQGVVPLPSRLH